jgi:hypothetical protein
MTFGRFVRSTALLVETHLITAVALGVMLRLAMRVVALSMGQPRVLTGATLVIFIVAVVLTAALSLLFFLLRNVIRGTPVRRGLVFGVIVLVVSGLGVFPEAITVGHAWLNVPMFAAILVLDGVLFSVVLDRLERRAARRRVGAAAVMPDPRPALQTATRPTHR